GGEGCVARPGESWVVTGTPAEFAGHVRRLLANPLLAACIGQAGRLHVERHHRWASAVSALEEVYSTLRAGSANSRSRRNEFVQGESRVNGCKGQKRSSIHSSSAADPIHRAPDRGGSAGRRARGLFRITSHAAQELWHSRGVRNPPDWDAARRMDGQWLW